ncbi:hypothetical protein [Colwellia sp. MB3u-4]|uniref:hypothetical protein n=1 Tax=Colwellia sp. MB3u-4 TaxID=2759822 RepID=UPI0015F730C8|nr:hypothetical protein [Colwellia sp. MB3u-4]MBA6288719.1 hypothetical protein [Colwellia sp. MB3u-4]
MFDMKAVSHPHSEKIQTLIYGKVKPLNISTLGKLKHLTKHLTKHMAKVQLTVKVCYVPNHLHQKLHLNSAHFTAVAIAASKVTKQMNNQVHQAMVDINQHREIQLERLVDVCQQHLARDKIYDMINQGVDTPSNKLPTH